MINYLSFNTYMKLNKIFCFHNWKIYIYNIETCSRTVGQGPLITISFRVCNKCAKSKLDFIFGNE